MPELPLDLRTRWNFDAKRRLITATQRVTNTDVEDLLDAATELNVSGHICIYSGVHGAPGGTLQVDDPRFYEADLKLAQEGTYKAYDPTIEVFKMPLQNQAPHDLTRRVAQPSMLVVLAWCYSDGYIQEESPKATAEAAKTSST